MRVTSHSRRRSATALERCTASSATASSRARSASTSSGIRRSATNAATGFASRTRSTVSARSRAPRPAPGCGETSTSRSNRKRCAAITSASGKTVRRFATTTWSSHTYPRIVLSFSTANVRCRSAAMKGHKRGQRIRNPQQEASLLAGGHRSHHQVHAETRNLRERAAPVAFERRQCRIHDIGEMRVCLGSFVECQPRVVDDVDAGSAKRGQKPSPPVHLHCVDEVLQHRFNEHSTRDAASQFWRAHSDEIVQVCADDRQELDPVEERNRVVLRLFEHASLESEEAQLTVVEQQRVARALRRESALDERPVRFARVGAERCAIWCSCSGRRMTRQTNRKESVRFHSSKQQQRWQTTYHTRKQS